LLKIQYERHIHEDGGDVHRGGKSFFNADKLIFRHSRGEPERKPPKKALKEQAYRKGMPSSCGSREKKKEGRKEIKKRGQEVLGN